MFAIRATLIAAVAAAAVPAHAVTFASYTQVGNTTTFRFANTGNAAARATDATFMTNASGTTPGAVNVRFSFTQPGAGLGGLVNNVAATLLITGSVARNTPATGNLVQPGLTGTMTFLSTAPITLSGPRFGTPVTLATGSNLLTVSFSNASITTSTGSSTGTFAGTTVTYTSDFLDFGGGANSFSLNMTNITPTAQAATGANRALRTARSRLAGSFNAAIAPANSAAPEPAAWAMLVLGFGLVGTSLRRRVAVRAA